MKPILTAWSFPARLSLPARLISNLFTNGMVPSWNVSKPLMMSRLTKIRIHTCQVLLGIAEEFWGPQATLNLIETLEPYWPPAQSPDGQPLTLEQSADLKDELQFKLGVNAALTGDFERATNVLTTLAENPANPEGPWGAAAQQFLASYQKPEDVYRACLQAAACKPADALSYLGTLLTKEDSSNPLAALTKWGVLPVASGYADFDREGTAERWVTIRHRPLETLDFWILAETKDGPRAVRVDWVDVNRPIQQITSLGAETDEENPAVIRLDSERLFSMKRQVGSLYPVIAWVKPDKFMNRFDRELLAAEQDLMNGGRPCRDCEEAHQPGNIPRAAVQTHLEL